MPKMKYSVMCPDFRIKPWTSCICSGEMEGIRKWNRGSMIREVFSAENVPVDIQKIKLIQRNTGTQYLKLRKELILLWKAFFQPQIETCYILAHGSISASSTIEMKMPWWQDCCDIIAPLKPLIVKISNYNLSDL